MSDAEQIMSIVWGRIIGEVRTMRDNKYTLERIGTILGVAKPTVQRWLENGAGGEKTAFIDVLRYLKALNLDLQELLEEGTGVKSVSLEALESVNAEKQAMSGELIAAQKELLLAQQKIIELQEKVIALEEHNADIADKARKAILAASKKSAAPEAAAPQQPAPPVQQTGRRRLLPGQFPDLPPIHLSHEK